MSSFLFYDFVLYHGFKNSEIFSQKCAISKQSVSVNASLQFPLSGKSACDILRSSLPSRQKDVRNKQTFQLTALGSCGGVRETPPFYLHSHTPSPPSQHSQTSLSFSFPAGLSRLMFIHLPLRGWTQHPVKTKSSSIHDMILFARLKGPRSEGGPDPEDTERGRSGF